MSHKLSLFVLEVLDLIPKDGSLSGKYDYGELWFLWLKKYHPPYTYISSFF